MGVFWEPAGLILAPKMHPKNKTFFGMIFGSLWEHLRTAQNPFNDIDDVRAETGEAWGRVRVGVNPTLFPTKDFPSKGLAGLEGCLSSSPTRGLADMLLGESEPV